MTFDEFKVLIDAYGANKALWPDDKHQDMQRIIDTYPKQSQPILQTAARLDAALDSVPTPQASDLLKTRIQKSVKTVPQSQYLSVPPKRSASTWSRLAATVAISFGAGFAGAQFLETSQAPTALATEIVMSTDTDWAVAANELGFTEIYEWTSGEEIDLTVSDL